MRLARQLHTYLGVFFAPSIIFFAFSGFFQSFGWHEEHDGKAPMAWIATISEIHKDQRFPAPPPAASPDSQSRPQPASPLPGAVTTSPATTAGATTPSSAPAQTIAATPGKAAPSPRRQPRKKSFPLQVFMGFMSVGLIGLSGVGIWMAYQLRKPALISTLLLAGTIIPFAALYIGTRT
jgi:hypothetical protein